MRALRQRYVLTPATKVAVNRSVVQPTTNFTYVIKSTNVYVFKLGINFVFICFAFKGLTRFPHTIY